MNPQEKLFILEYRSQVYFKFEWKRDDITLNKISELKIQNYKSAFDYVKIFKNLKKQEKLIPNSQKRYTITHKLGSDSDNSFINVMRLFNFFENTGLPCNLFYESTKLNSKILICKNNKEYLHKIFFSSISYGGNDSTENNIQVLVSSLLRFIDLDSLEAFYKKILNIIEFRITKHYNVSIYIYVLTEIMKRLPRERYNSYLEYLNKQIINKETQVVNSIQRGSVWGWKEPFIFVIKSITDFTMYKSIFTWVFHEYLLDMKEYKNSASYRKSEFYDYAYALISLKNFENDKKELFSTSEIQEIIQFDIENYSGKIALLAFKYLQQNVQDKLSETQIGRAHV